MINIHSMFKNAGSAEIIRSHQKDDFYLSYLRSCVSDISQAVLGPRTWMRWRKELDISADLGYFLLTTFAGYQTVGEEYVNIIQVDPTMRAVPSKLRRSLMIVFHVCTPYVLQHLMDRADRFLKSGDAENIPAETRAFLLRCISVLRHSVTFIHRFHLAAFYLHGIFYHISKRLSGVQYIKYNLRRNREEGMLQRSFRLLGVLSLIQLCGSLLVQMYRAYRDRKKSSREFPQEGTDDGKMSFIVDASRKCSLCLEERKSTTATPCGHMFCWNCIHEWCQNKPQCPLCREKLQPQSLVYLQNYDPP